MALLISLILTYLLGGCSGTPPFNALRAYDDLVKQCSFGPRAPNTRAHSEAQQFLFDSLRKTTELCRLQRFTYYDSVAEQTLDLANVIASFNPSSKRRIMLCAHWDSRPRSDQDPDSTNRNLPVPGANDGASGAAVLLELGRVLKDHEPPVGVDLVLFDGEDYGLVGHTEGWFLGSQYFAEHLGSYHPRLAILIDMIGDKDLHVYREAISQKYAGDLADHVWGIAVQIGASAFVDSVKHTVSDDHISLLSHGIKAIDIIDFDYPYWHTQQDTPDKCSPASLGTIGQVLLAAIFDKRTDRF